MNPVLNHHCLETWTGCSGRRSPRWPSGSAMVYKEHLPPHFHAKYAGQWAAFSINFQVLEATVEAEHLTHEIIAAGDIPEKAVGDAAHIAIAAVNDMNYLLTWNCRHLANARLLGGCRCSAISKVSVCL